MCDLLSQDSCSKLREIFEGKVKFEYLTGTANDKNSSSLIHVLSKVSPKQEHPMDNILSLARTNALHMIPHILERSPGTKKDRVTFSMNYRMTDQKVCDFT